MTAQQLLLDLHRHAPPTFENFVAGSNGELMDHIRELTLPHNEEAVYLWGPEGCGRTHLLAATAIEASQRRTVSFFAGDELDHLPEIAPGSLLVVDDIDTLSSEGQSVLFRLYNSARTGAYALLLSGPAAPSGLKLREDLRTRIGQCLIYELKPLSDEEKAAALRHHAAGRGMRLEPPLINYLLRHGRRDLSSLLSLVDALDRASLESKRPATLPLLREIMQAASMNSSPAP